MICTVSLPTHICVKINKADGISDTKTYLDILNTQYSWIQGGGDRDKGGGGEGDGGRGEGGGEGRRVGKGGRRSANREVEA